MFSRRGFLKRSAQGSALVALGTSVPAFLAATARAAESKAEKILVVVELTGGNDGLNTVIPHGDDLYHAARPKLRYDQGQVLRLDDYHGLHPALAELKKLYDDGSLSIVQGVGYPNPNRSHFESMDVWQSADPAGKTASGWLGRGSGMLRVAPGRIPAFHVAQDDLPLALRGAATAVPTLHPDKPFGLDFGANTGPQDETGRGEARLLSAAGTDSQRKREALVRHLAETTRPSSNELLQFVQRTSVDTYATVDRLRKIVRGEFDKPDGQFNFRPGRGVEITRSGLNYELSLVARMIQADLGARVFYVAIDGFDTHGDQRQTHADLLSRLSSAVANFFELLDAAGESKRVLLMTYSEFGRRVRENGSQGTDHGSGSNLLIAGPSAKGGLVGKHPSLHADELDRGDLKFHTDFRRVYATVLDRWLEVDSRRVLGEKFEHVGLLA